MSEKQLATLIDKDDNVTGYKNKLDTHRWPTPLHRAISVVIFNKDKILLQKRSPQKPVWPLYWSNACCANVLKGESYEQCAKRRLREEMGIITPLKKVFSFIYKARYNKSYGEHELDQVFTGEYSGLVKLDSDEAVSYKWLDKDELEKDLKTNPDKYTPWFKLIVKRLIFA